LVISTLLSTVNVLSAIYTFRGDEVDSVFLVLVGIPEVHPEQGSTSPWVMKHLTDDPLDVAMTLSIVKMPVQRVSDALVLMGSEH
jgi:hypothetical protein